MNKTFTAALAISAISGLALADHTPATVDTPPAGYVDVTSTSKFVINPFTSFSGGSLTLADIDGSALSDARIRVLNEKGKKVFDAKWNSNTWKEWNGSEYGADKGSYTLDRGVSVMLITGESAETLTMAGVLTSSGETVTCAKGQNYVGNVSPVDKDLTDFTIGGSFDPWSDYVAIGGAGTKYVYDNGWYLRSDYLGTSASITAISANEVTIPAGEGFRVYTPSGNGATVSLPGL